MNIITVFEISLRGDDGFSVGEISESCHLLPLSDWTGTGLDVAHIPGLGLRITRFLSRNQLSSSIEP